MRARRRWRPAKRTPLATSPAPHARSAKSTSAAGDSSRAPNRDFVFRTPFVEPLYTTGYALRKPPHALVPGRVYLSTSSQVYPNVTSWNGATELSRAVVDTLLAECDR